MQDSFFFFFLDRALRDRVMKLAGLKGKGWLFEDLRGNWYDSSQQWQRGKRVKGKGEDFV